MPTDDTTGGRAVPRPSRRRALGVMGTVGMAGAVLPGLQAHAQSPLRLSTPTPALVPRGELVNVLEYEAQARLVLGPTGLAPIAGGDRTVTDRITLRPRMNIPARDMDLTRKLFGDDHFTPIIVGPVAHQKRFHAEGELATARGASAAKAALVVSDQSDQPLSTIANATTSPVYLQVSLEAPRLKASLKERLAEAAEAKVKAIFVTLDGSARIDWTTIEKIAQATALPVVVKGIERPEDARQAVNHGAAGVVVSTWRERSTNETPGSLLHVAPIVEAVGGRAPVLVDGSFRRGTDILKALAFGAQGVLIARPVMWGLAAYGAEGAQGVVAMLQTELARYMGMCGCPTLAAITPALVRVHAPLPTGNARV